MKIERGLVVIARLSEHWELVPGTLGLILGQSPTFTVIPHIIHCALTKATTKARYLLGVWLAQPSLVGSVSLVQFDEGSQEEAKLPAATGQHRSCHIFSGSRTRLKKMYLVVNHYTSVVKAQSMLGLNSSR